MNEHSPGDWRVSGTSIVSDDYCIAVIEDDGGHEAPAEQRQANAKLLAAAPKLLAACKSVLLSPGNMASLECAIAEAT